MWYSHIFHPGTDYVISDDNELHFDISFKKIKSIFAKMTNFGRSNFELEYFELNLIFIMKNEIVSSIDKS